MISPADFGMGEGDYHLVTSIRLEHLRLHEGSGRSICKFPARLFDVRDADPSEQMVIPPGIYQVSRVVNEKSQSDPRIKSEYGWFTFHLVQLRVEINSDRVPNMIHGGGRSLGFNESQEPLQRLTFSPLCIRMHNLHLLQLYNYYSTSKIFLTVNE